MNSAGLAVVGAGVIGKRHIAAIKQTSSAKLTALVDPDSASKALAADHQVSWYSSTEELFASATDAARVDGVIVATPTEHHQSPTLLTLDAGRHVLVEKPIMATLEEAQAVIDRSQVTNRHVLVGHHRRYYDRVDRARQLIDAGRLGQLVAISGQWTVRKHDDYYTPSWRKNWKAGPILTNLIHEIDTLRYICGEIVSLSAQTSNNVQQFEKEDVAAIVLQFANGALGSFIISDQTLSPWSWEMATGENAAFPPSGQNAIRFMGTEASLDFPNLTLWEPESMPGSWLTPLARTPLEEQREDAYINQINHFAAVIRGDESPRITAADATATLRATLAVYEAASTGQRVLL